MDDLQQLLLSQMAGDSDQTADVSIADLLERSLGDNPLAAPLAAAFRRRQEQEMLTIDAVDDTDDVEDRAAGVADVLSRLYDEVESLRYRVTLVADALGACRLCWGENPGCVGCRGRGQPGGRSPNELLFSELVGPVLRRRRRERARHTTQPWPQRTDTSADRGETRKETEDAR